MSGLGAAVGPLLPVVIVVATGAGLARLGLLPPEVRRGVEKLVYFVLLPALLVDKLSSASLVGIGGDVARMGAALGSATLAVAGLVLLLSRVAGVPERSRGTLAQAGIRGNLAFVGLPVVALAAGGDPGPAARAALVLGPMVVLYNVVSVPLLIGVDRSGGPAAAARRVARPLATNPILLACVGGLALAAMPALPGPAARSVALLGQPAGPLALLCLGAAITAFPVRTRLRHAALAIAFKSVAIPAFAVGAGVALGLRGDDLRSVAIFASAPTAVASYVLTTQLGGDEELAAAAIAATTVFSVVPLTLAMSI
ncbi:AEC family transporter [Phycisphaera mikurensis]|uniref:AEC family transporter n=1 Tax=Phycisphaera mikurensis TaxID=547188 RepID=UPI001612F7A7|nr:AEC family transporter [Phycisphaera mikurensis]